MSPSALINELANKIDPGLQDENALCVSQRNPASHYSRPALAYSSFSFSRHYDLLDIRAPRHRLIYVNSLEAVLHQRHCHLQ